MKTLFTCLIALILTSMCLAQTPINYKAIIKDTNGTILSNRLIDIEFSILKGSELGTIVYSEDTFDVTNANGLIKFSIGQGTPITGTFSDINWNDDSYFLNVKVDIGDGYVDMGTTAFKAVPYAYSSSKISESPNRTLEVAGEGNQNIRINSIGGGQPQLEFFKAGISTDWRLETSGIFLDIEVSDDDFATSEGKFTFRSNGRLGVNTLSPSTELDVNGSIRTRDLAGTGTRLVSADAQGDLVAVTDLAGSGTRLVSANAQGDLIIDTTPKTSYYSIPARGFHNTGAFARFRGNNVSGRNGVFDMLFAPVHLPHGAIIKKFKVHYTDSAIDNLRIELLGVDINDPGGSLSNETIISELITSGEVISLRTIESPTLTYEVNNQAASYYVRIRGQFSFSVLNLSIRAVVITYELPQ